MGFAPYLKWLPSDCVICCFGSRPQMHIQAKRKNPRK